MAKDRRPASHADCAEPAEYACQCRHNSATISATEANHAAEHNEQDHGGQIGHVCSRVSARVRTCRPAKVRNHATKAVTHLVHSFSGGTTSWLMVGGVAASSVPHFVGVA